MTPTLFCTLSQQVPQFGLTNDLHMPYLQLFSYIHKMVIHIQNFSNLVMVVYNNHIQSDMPQSSTSSVWLEQQWRHQRWCCTAWTNTWRECYDHMSIPVFVNTESETSQQCKQGTITTLLLMHCSKPQQRHSIE